VLWFEVDPCRLNDELDALEKRDAAITASVVDGLLHVETKVVIVSFEWPPERIGTHRWHINHDGSVCFGDPSIWTAQMTLVEVLDKVSDWLTNYLALDAGVIDEMPASGTYAWIDGKASA
jgi:hypothetical protein